LKQLFWKGNLSLLKVPVISVFTVCHEFGYSLVDEALLLKLQLKEKNKELPHSHLEAHIKRVNF